MKDAFPAGWLGALQVSHYPKQTMPAINTLKLSYLLCSKGPIVDRSVLGAGYTANEKAPVNDVLGKIVQQLRRSNSVRKTFHIRNSRVPIIKVT